MRRPMVALILLGLLAVSCSPPQAEGSGSAKLRIYSGDDGDPDAPVPPLDCEAEGYPCSWDLAPEGVLDRSLSLATRALDAYDDGGSVAAAEWLRGQSGVVRIEVGSDVAGFRLEGGRYTWVGEPSGLRPTPPSSAGGVTRSAAPGASTRWVERLAAVLFPTVHGQVVGRDQNGDGKLNQHDVRTAVVLEKMLLRDGRTGSLVEFAASPSYAGHVDFKRGALGYMRGGRVSGTPGWKDFLGWERYDVIHVETVGVSTCWTLPDDLLAGEVGGFLDEIRRVIRDGLLADDPAAPTANCRLRGLFSGDFFESSRATPPPSTPIRARWVPKASRWTTSSYRWSGAAIRTT